MSGGNRWIVSARTFHEHKTIEKANAEVERLQELVPGKPFRLYRIKRAVIGGSNALTENYLQSAIQSFEYSPADSDFQRGYLAALEAIHGDLFLTQEERAAKYAEKMAEAAE